MDASALSIKTNVGTTLPKDGNGNFDCTIKPSETIRLSVSGTDAAATWAVADASVLSISADGLITPAKVGTTTVTATVGGAVLTITVRIKEREKERPGAVLFLRKKGRLSLQALPACATITLKKYLQELSTI